MSFIASLDVGTTSLRCFIFNENCQIKGSASELVELLNPRAGYFEIEPEKLWLSIVNVISNAIKDANLNSSDITCLGISTQRCTFLTWDSNTHEYFHNFITWKDCRADGLVNKWNSGLMLKTLNTLSYGLYILTRSKRFLAGSVLKMMNGQVTLRLIHEIEANPKLKEAIENKTAVVDTLDSWIIYKLRTGLAKDLTIQHITDITSATATGLFDPFTLGWSDLMKMMFGINLSLLPKVVTNSDDFGCVHESLFGTRIPITSSVSDQTASLWGSNCFDEGDMKITMGTGSFLDLITGKHCQASIHGLYPLVAWQFKNTKLNDELVFCVEGAAQDTGTLICWAQSCGLFNDPSETSDIAHSVENTGGVYFIPAFSGIGPPVNDYKAASGFLGITPSTTRAHLVRAILESIAFRIAQICEATKSETNYNMQCLKVDGGVSKNDFICQFLADLVGISVERAVNSESSVLGSAYIAGLNIGIWKNRDEIRKFRIVDKLFKPREEFKSENRERMNIWERSVERFKEWY
ncbi:putative glycerol kinase 5 [Eupeodes corollae]|uniref:putative glycerol kinase 5 n=1 Tax=Eupeodes corollae TaxID=290404 RepID=UPI002490A59E|nr:putative glycerol kinase 5 [Eupeodes corollae]